MSVRSLRLSWHEVINRLAVYQRPIVFAATLFAAEDGPWQTWTATIRGGQPLEPCDYRYAQPDGGTIRLVRLQCDDATALLELLRRGTFGVAQLPTAPLTSNQDAVWLTQGTDYGTIAATSTPRLCIWHAWSGPSGEPDWTTLERPLHSRGKPFYPTLKDGMGELLYGRTDLDTGRHAMLHRLDLSLAYDDAYLSTVEWIEEQGLHVVVGRGEPITDGEYRVHVIWQMNTSDISFQRSEHPVTTAGTIVVKTGAAPSRYSVALTKDDNLIDEVDGRVRTTDISIPPLPPSAIADAFDFLDSAWRNFFGVPLLYGPSLGDAADLAIPTSTKADFSVRLSRLADLLKACRVDDRLLDPNSRVGRDETVKRIGLAADRALGGAEHSADRSRVDAALRTLIRMNQLRVALQHHVKERGKPDVPTALANMEIAYPPDWGEAWEIVRWKVVDALSEVRRVLRASLSRT